VSAKAAWDIGKALGGRQLRAGQWVARCPAHPDRTPSLSITDGKNGVILTHCHAGCSQAAVIAALRQLDLWPANAAKPPEAEQEEQRRKNRRRHEEQVIRQKFITKTWQQLWAESQPLIGSPIETWLRVRGIDSGRLDLDRLEVLRWHPRCTLGNGRHPAMLALMTDPFTNESAGVHRTFLQSDGSGKAVIPEPRMMLGSAGVIRLSPDDEVELGLGLTEGVENGLAVMAAGWRPVWACGCLGMLQRFPVLPGIVALTVFADAKPHEIEGARACAQRWVDAGREAFVYVPPSGGDWNAILSEGATR
jgi:hypothetical protein